jgi:hypothetical protein
MSHKKARSEQSAKKARTSQSPQPSRALAGDSVARQAALAATIPQANASHATGTLRPEKRKARRVAAMTLAKAKANAAESHFIDFPQPGEASP